MNLFILAAMTVANCLGTLALRHGASSAGPAVTIWAITGVGLYVAGAGLQLHLMTASPLGVLAAVTSIAGMGAMIAVGHLVYGEGYSSVQLFGLALGLTAVGLIVAGR